jgi:hypothetical protein
VRGGAEYLSSVPPLRQRKEPEVERETETKKKPKRPTLKRVSVNRMIGNAEKKKLVVTS